MTTVDSAVQGVRRSRRLQVSADAWIDAAFLLVMAGAALLGLGSIYTGWAYAIAGLAGLLIGTGITVVTNALRWPSVVPAICALAVFYLGGGVVTAEPGSSRWPTVDTVQLLSQEVLLGWKDLLTTLPPVTGTGPLVALPWGLGLFTGVVGMVLAASRIGPRWLKAWVPLVAPAALLALVILLGVGHPHSLWMQGAIFAISGLAWLSVRGQRASADVTGRSGRASRLVFAGALLGATGLLAAPVGTWAFGSNTERVVLRTRVDPPFDIGQYPSPLASFRRYVDMDKKPSPENVYDQTLFVIDGVEAGTRVRFATLDRYDGVVWGAANNTIPGSDNDTYQRVSSTIDNPVPGQLVRASVTVGPGYSGVWLPVAGALQTLEFEAGDVDAKTESFRFNLATSTAVVPSGVHEGDRYSFSAVLVDDSLDIDSLPSGDVGEAGVAAAFLESQAAEWPAGETAPLRRVFAVADHLREEGKYSDGVAEAEKAYRSGHHVKRLADEFVNAPIMAGNDEQYAAVMALLANRLGVPARVVMGAVVPEGGDVHGSDVAAWVELQLSDGTWRTLPTEAFMGDERPAKLPPQSQQEQSGVRVPPPAPVPPPSVIGEQTETEVKARRSRPGDETPETVGKWPLWLGPALVFGVGPFVVLLTFVACVAVAKRWRRTSRRRSRRVSARFVGAWRELVDHARDLGQPVPVGALATRREQSVALPTAGAIGLAREADARVFGPVPPKPSDATAYWKAIAAERKALSNAAGRKRRLGALFSLRSFSPGRDSSRPRN
jgi:hypothetical protein